MRLLLGSGGFRTPERIARFAEQMRRLFGNLEEILFIPHALRDHDGYVKIMTERGLHAGYRLRGLHRCENPAQAIMDAKGVFVGGGNTFRLLKEMQDHGWLTLLRERVRAGLPYAGVSAGANLACPTIATTNDMPIVWPSSLEALGLVPFQINAHYWSGQTFVQAEGGFHEHFGETRDERLAQFHEHYETTVVGLWEAGMLVVDGERIDLEATPARLFFKGLPPVDVTPPAPLHTLLNKPRIVYTVAATFTDPAIAREWVVWLKSGHVDEVLKGGASDAEIVELIAGESYEVHYHFVSRELFAIYEREHAPRLRGEAMQLFPPERGVTYRRSLGAVV